jgi:xanthine dehydrogenase/oxidase
MAPIAISPERDGQLDTLADLTAKFEDTIRFYLNGTKVVLDEIDPEITVLEYLRGIGLTGTKLYDSSPVSTVSSHSETHQRNKTNKPSN